MTAHRWLGFSLVGIILAWSGVADATVSMSPNPIAVGNVAVSSTGMSSGVLSSTQNNVTVDVVPASGCNAVTLSHSGGLTNINLNADQTINVSVAPTTRGAINCSVNVNDTATAAVLATFTVTATGVAPVVSAPSSLTFAATRWNDFAVVMTASQTLTITNNGDLSLSIASLAFSGTNASDFTVSAGATLPATIAPSTSQSWTVTMNPSAAGARVATLTITSNDPTTPSLNVSLSGTGTNAVIGVSDVTLPNAPIGGSPTTGVITVSNLATTNIGTLTAMTASITSQTKPWFSFGTGSGCTAGQTTCSLSSFTMGTPRSIPVRCQIPSNDTTAATAIVDIQSDSDPGGDSVAMLTCTPAQHASPSPSSLAFGDIEVGKTSNAQTLTVTNTGGVDLSITNAALTSLATEYVVTGPASATVTAGSSVSWDIACHPTSQGAKNTAFRITSNTDGVAGTTLDVTLSCNGLQGVLTIVPSSYNFGGVREFFTASQNFTLTNTGNVTVSNINATLDAKLLGFSLTAPTLPTTLGAGQSAVVTVQFAPQSGSDGCAVATAGDCTIRFIGQWGVTPTMTAPATLLILGDGLTTGYDTSPAAPNALDFGSIRWDTTKSLPVSVINTAGTTLQIRGFSITPDSSTMAGEFAVLSCTKNGVPITCPTMLSPYTSSGTNDTIVLNVACDPNNRIGMLGGTLTVFSDLASNPNRTVPLKCNSITAGLAVDPATNVLDFGPTDLDAVPVSVTRTISLTNSGTATLNLGAGVKTGAANYVASALPATTVAPGAAFSITVTYTPIVERAANQPDIGSIVIPLTGIVGGPTSVTIQLSGYGVDRHIAVAPAPTFPDTYINPGSGAPVLPITITNNGDANLDVTMTMISGDPVWQLLNPGAMRIPGRQSYSFMIKFSPNTVGKAPMGRVTLTDNDNLMKTVYVDLTGNGVDRALNMLPGTIELGYTGIGVPIRLSTLVVKDQGHAELLTVNNLDPVPWTIEKLSVADSEIFVIEDESGMPPDGTVMAARTAYTFDVVFTPDAAGEFNADAKLTLKDTDPATPVIDPGRSVHLHGVGLYVDAGGGGGCSTGRGGGGAMILVVAAVLLARRRHAATIVVLVAASGGVRADDSRNLALTVFDPTPATVGTTLHVQGADVGKDGDYVATALVSYAHSPLVLYDVQNDVTTIRSRTMLELGGAYALGGRLELGLRMPIYIQSGDSQIDQTRNFSVAPASGAARGDLTLHGKLKLGGTAGLAYGTLMALTLPTRSDGEFTGNDLPTGRVVFLLSLVRGPWTLVFDAGGIVRVKSEFQNHTEGSGLTWGLGSTLRVKDGLWIDAEFFGDLIPGGRTDEMGEPRVMNTIEGLGGLRFQLARTTSLTVAGGRGVTKSFGSPAARAVVTLSYTPGADELKPLHPYRPAGPAKDSDGDGIPDKVDACPHEAEDTDQFEDSDGCPDLDNDQDGIPDSRDKCPLDPEDKDNFEDDNGCPDNDNDYDGIPDALDKCPFAAEDRDGFEDADGCPEPDNDHDGLLDAVDKCPLQPETINGNNDDDGCPDKGDSFVVVAPDRLELLESIQFQGRDQIARTSRSLLAQIGATLRAHPEILRLRITAHVQPTANAEADKTLSEAHAKAVKQWLVDWGVDSLRLQTAGFGGTKPLASPTQHGAAQVNDRIELIILERK